MSVAERAITADTAPARSRAETRRRLLEAGTELFAREGLHGVTTARIARDAGVATGTFYLHFPDKHALFREIAFEALARLRERQARARARAGGAPADQVRASLAELLAFAEENRSLFQVLFGRDHEAARLGEDVLDAVVPGIEERLREHVSAGQASRLLHPAVTAQALAAMTTRVVAWWVQDPSRAPREAVIETLARLHPVGRSQQ
jgi:AcrR family transcriptional regulator